MAAKTLFGSLTRISDLADEPFAIEPLAREHWDNADYVVGEVTSSPGPLSRLELQSGRMVEVLPGDRIVGAFGVRRATLEAVGDWQEIRQDGRMHELTSAALFGRATSRSPLLPQLLGLRYTGHVVRSGAKVTMRSFARRLEPRPYLSPTVLLIGTSMSAGKTTTARVIVHELALAGLSVFATKLSGAGRYRDILTMHDAGAGAVLDFVDAGLPSTICPPDEYRTALASLLASISEAAPDVVVVEAGASPLEPYNGDVVLERLADQVRVTVLCATDPYSVVGVMKGYGITPDLVTGIATSTSAGIELVEKLTGIPALNVLARTSVPALRQLLSERLGVELPVAA